MRIAVTLCALGSLVLACKQPQAPVPPPGSGAPSGSVPGDLSVKRVLRYPTRLAVGPSGKLYVSDARVGSVFIYDATMRAVGELKNLRRPLGVVVDSRGQLYVGSGADKSGSIYSSAGVRLRTVGAGVLEMPNDLALDSAGRLYVADSPKNVVRVFDPDGALAKNLTAAGTTAFRFPSSVHVAAARGSTGRASAELYVANQGASRVHVFDLEGRHLRSFGGPVAAFSLDWKGRFVKIQSLVVDQRGRLHALDSYLQTVQILDSRTGRFLGSYGRAGRAAGMLRLPLGLALFKSGMVAVANAENGRLETYSPADVKAGEVAP